MTPEHSKPAEEQARSPLPPSPLSQEPDEELRALGEVMERRVDEVLDLIVARTTGPEHDIDPVVQDRFERISRNASGAVARWIGGADMKVAIEAGKEAWEIFGELAVHRAGLHLFPAAA